LRAKGVDAFACLSRFLSFFELVVLSARSNKGCRPVPCVPDFLIYEHSQESFLTTPVFRYISKNQHF